MAHSVETCERDAGEPQVCETCGAPASFFLYEVRCVAGDASQSTPTNRSLCVRCARTQGLYPGLWRRMMSRVIQAALRPFAPMLMRRLTRKHPDIWAELEPRRKEMRGDRSAP